MIEADHDFTLDVYYYTYLKTEIAIKRYGNVPEFYQVIIILRNNDEMPIVKANKDIILGTHTYEV